MKVFEKRPLALILSIMLGGFSFFIDFDWKIRLILAAVSLLMISIIYIFDTLKSGRKLIVIICLVALSISLLCSSVWSLLFFPSKFYDTEAQIEAKIYRIDNSDSATSLIVLKSEKINGKRYKRDFIAYVDREDSVYLRQYDIVSFSAAVSEFSSYDNGFDGRTYYISKGYSAYLSEVSDIEVHVNEVDRIDSFFSKLQLKISNVLKLRTDFDTGAFLSALLVGNRTDLNGNIKLNFARLGISHILALSGMHLAILALAINTAFIKLGVKKKTRLIILIAFIVFYMALTGFIVSVVRSGLMLIIASLLYLLFKNSDPITSLLISVFCIVVFNPNSVYDLSLWLSAFATLGVIAFSEIAEKPDKNANKPAKILIFLKNSCLVSIFAFCATFALTALRFDYFSVASIFTTLIFSFLIQLLIYGGILLLLFGWIIPFGKIIVFMSNAILSIAEAVSSVKFVYVSMNSFIVKALVVLLTVFFFAFLVFEIKNRRKGLVIILAMLMSVYIVAEINTVSRAYDDDALFSPCTSGDTFILKSDGDVTAIYSGKAYSDGGWDVLDLFADQCIVYVDNFVFASYSYSTIDFAQVIVNGIKVEKIMLPRPVTNDELNQAEGLSDLLVSYGTHIEFYDEIEYLDFGEYRYRLLNKTDYTYGKYPANVFEIVLDEERVTYTSVCDYDNLSPSAKALIFNSQNLLIGTIGNSNYYLFDMHLPKVNNVYFCDEGRLTDEALEYYNKKGASTLYVKTPLSIFN